VVNALDKSLVQFMIVDDDEVCVMAAKRALKNLELEGRSTFAKNGLEALDALEQSLTPSGVLPPTIIVLDLNMPKMSGLEFLERIQHEPAYQTAVVFVLTSSAAKSDIDNAYRYNIAGYMLKNSPIDSIADAMQMLKTYSELVVIPS